MVNKNKDMENFANPQSIGNFFVLYEDQEAYTYGWISIEGSLQNLRIRIEEELEFSWGLEFADISEYRIFNVEIGEHYNLKEIRDDLYYQHIKEQKEIFIVLLHKNIKTRLIENLPDIYEWVRGDIFYL